MTRPYYVGIHQPACYVISLRALGLSLRNMLGKLLYYLEDPSATNAVVVIAVVALTDILTVTVIGVISAAIVNVSPQRKKLVS